MVIGLLTSRSLTINTLFFLLLRDNVEWDAEQEELAKANVAKNSEISLSTDEIMKYDNEADKFWDKFYDIHQNRFFKDRHWLFTEFAELAPLNTAVTPERVYADSSDVINRKLEDMSLETNVVSSGRKIFEIGSGVGNTVFPILKYSQEPDLMVYASDFSSNAIRILKENPEFDEKRCQAFILDGTSPIWDVPFEEGSIDIIILIFVLSSIDPEKMQHVVNQCYKYLKPNGLIVLRDYGRYDLAQLRFKQGKCLTENFYVRGDGTRVYFFTQDDLRDIFTKAGFIEEQNIVDRRLQVNRGKLLKMYRVWIQTKFRKPLN